ncbi:MAG TPA: AsmA family protein [Bradyrhizobium sp.]|nr:AsmA family protein [Bradyrhizobium sp.]
MQTTLLGLAIAFIIALLAALIGPYFIDWNQFRPQFEAEASKVIGAPLRVAGDLSARLLPTPSLRLRYIVVGRANDLGKVRAEKLDVEFSLGDLMRGEWRANELTISGAALDLGLDPQGRIDLPISNGKFNFGSLSIDRLNLTGRVALHDAASRQTLELNDIAFSGEVRSTAGSVRGEGSFALDGARHGFNVSSGQTADGNGTRVHLGIDPGEQTPSADVDGVLSFDGRAPRFEGAVALAAPPVPKAKAGDNAPASWRIAAKVKASRAAAQLEQIDASYGNDERALRLAGFGDIRFDASPEAHVTLSARQLDADKFLAKEGANAQDGTKERAAEPVRLLPGLRALLAALPRPPISTLVSFNTEKIMLGGRPLQNLGAELHIDAAAPVRSWAIDRLDVRAPGVTQISLSAGVSSGSLGNFSGVLDVDSTDPDVLLMWLQGRTDVGYRGQQPLRLRGNIDVTADRIAIEALTAEIDGGAVEGRAALSNLSSGKSSHFEATLKAERLDLDAATAFARSVAGPQADWPDDAQVSLDIGRAISAGQEMRAFTAKFGYSPKTVVLDKIKFGQPDGMTLEGSGNFDRVNSIGKLALDSTTASIGQLTGLIAPFAPSAAARLNTLGTGAGPVRAKLALDLGKSKEQPADRAAVRADLEFDAPLLKGRVTMTTTPPVAAIRGLDLETLRQGEIAVETRFSAQRGDALIALLGLDRAVAAGEGAVQFEGALSGAWGASLRLNAKLWGAGMDADAQGAVEPWAGRAGANVRVRSVNLAPMFGLKPSDGPLRNVRLFARASLAGNKLTFDDLDSVAAGSRLRGRLTLNLEEPREVNGEVGLDALDLASAFGFAIGAGRDPAEPLGGGLVKGWRGRVGFQALGGTLPGSGELRPVMGTIVSDGQSLTLEGIKGRIGGGEATASVDAKQDASGIALNARLDLANVDGAALHYRGLKMPVGRTSLQLTLSSQGRSVAALVGALYGSGTATLESASLAGLDPRAFDVAIRASDSGQPTDDARLRQVVEPVLTAGALPVASAQIPFTVREGRLRVGATTLEATGGRVIVSGGYDFPADQVDIRASLASTAANAPSNLPEIQLLAVGTPDALNRTIDVAALSSWLAVRTIDRETRRLDSIERGLPLPPEPALVPPSTASLPPPAAPNAAAAIEQPPPDAAREPRRVAPKPRLVAPHPPALAPAPPVVSQQIAPLPPPIDVKPAPGSAALKPRPRPPMVLTPPLAIP